MVNEDTSGALGLLPMTASAGASFSTSLALADAALAHDGNYRALNKCIATPYMESDSETLVVIYSGKICTVVMLISLGLSHISPHLYLRHGVRLFVESFLGVLCSPAYNHSEASSTYLEPWCLVLTGLSAFSVYLERFSLKPS